MCSFVCVCVLDQAEPTVWAGQGSAYAGGETTAAAQGEGIADCATACLSVRSLMCARSNCLCMCVLCSTLWRRLCCLPVRSWVNRTSLTLQPHRVLSSRETCCRAVFSAPAESCPGSTPWVHTHSQSTAAQVLRCHQNKLKTLESFWTQIGVSEPHFM